ncbi:MAG: hypothetical protein MUP76_10910 [Acidimicrobiia bacterium]|nr:hypothetical protein [Acidimicrobiia bacterium]
MRRANEYLCGRCALKEDWEIVARTAQGLSVRTSVMAAGQDAPAAPAADGMSPADPFAG